MATSSDKSKNPFPAKAPAKTHDFSFDPLPVPDAIESDSDTAWGLWEHTLQAHDAPDTVIESDTVYDETIPATLGLLNSKKD